MEHALTRTLTAPADAQARIAAQLANFYAECAGLDGPASPPFSLARVLTAQLNGRPLEGREAEICESAALIAGQHFDANRTWIPLPALASRAMTTIPGAKGGYTVGVDTLDPVDVLRPWSVIASAGTMMLTGLLNGVLLPRTVTATTASWLSEGGSGPSESPPTLGNVSVTPKTAIGLIKFSAQLLRQGVAVEAFLRAQLLRAVGELLDTAYFAGAGGAQPLGLLQTPGIGSQAGAALSHAGILAMRRTVLTAGARESALQWVGTPVVQEALGARERATGGGRFLWDTDGVLGKPAYATKNAAASALVVGDFGQSVAAMFGPGIRIDVDPSQDFNSAGLVARVLLMCDVAFPQPSAFSVATSVT